MFVFIIPSFVLNVFLYTCAFSVFDLLFKNYSQIFKWIRKLTVMLTKNFGKRYFKTGKVHIEEWSCKRNSVIRRIVKLGWQNFFKGNLSSFLMSQISVTSFHLFKCLHSFFYTPNWNEEIQLGVCWSHCLAVWNIR